MTVQGHFSRSLEEFQLSRGIHSSSSQGGPLCLFFFSAISNFKTAHLAALLSEAQDLPKSPKGWIKCSALCAYNGPSIPGNFDIHTGDLTVTDESQQHGNIEETSVIARTPSALTFGQVITDKPREDLEIRWNIDYSDKNSSKGRSPQGAEQNMSNRMKCAEWSRGTWMGHVTLHRIS